MQSIFFIARETEPIACFKQVQHGGDGFMAVYREWREDEQGMNGASAELQ